MEKTNLFQLEIPFISGIRLNFPLPFRRIFPINKGGGKLCVLTKSFIKIFRFAENKGRINRAKNCVVFSQETHLNLTYFTETRIVNFVVRFLFLEILLLDWGHWIIHTILKTLAYLSQELISEAMFWGKGILDLLLTTRKIWDGSDRFYPWWIPDRHSTNLVISTFVPKSTPDWCPQTKNNKTDFVE